ncbi:zinc finger CCCH domain-containing protein 3, partial [Sphaerodactylus townsendi]|uniref:zinc finger CCCH domain-containing protein 3 n=1 Tax=Sphaerodactylus townsendi TaxID=933632 RepID=UPI002026A435
MEENEQLRRQIRLLQGLINDHKNVHGNAPAVSQPTPAPRWRNPRPPSFSNQTVFSARYSQQGQRDFQPHRHNAWRKKYSLVNVPPRTMLNPGGSISSSDLGLGPNHGTRTAEEPQPVLSERRVDVAADGNITVGVHTGSVVRIPMPQGGPSEAAEGPSTSRRCETSALAPDVPSKESKRKRLSTVPHPLPPRTVARGRDDSLSVRLKGSVPSGVVQGASDSTLLKTISEQAITLKTEPQQPKVLPGHEPGRLSARKKPALQETALRTSQQVPVAVAKMKTERIAETTSLHPASVRDAPSAGEGTPSKNKFSAPVLQTAPTLLAPTKSPKFRKTNYTWVANPSKCPCASKRWSASRASESGQKLAGGAERPTKLAPRADLGAKQKRSGPHLKQGMSSSKYKWKASSPRLSPSPSASAFTWQREERGGPPAPHFSGASSSLPAASRVPFGRGDPKPTFGNASFLNYKLKSRTKIIKRKGSA